MISAEMKHEYLGPLEIALVQRVRQAFLDEAVVNDVERGFIFAPSTNQLRDPELQQCVARIIAAEFGGVKIDKIFGIPISGIPLATATAALIPGVKEIPTRKGVNTPGSWEKVFTAEVESFTTEVTSSIKYSYVEPKDRILVVDDVCAYGNTAVEVIRSLLNDAQAEVVGLAVWWDKIFQGGLKRVEEEFRMETFSVVRVKEIRNNGEIILLE